MSSANKTTNLGLNQWAGNEYPLRQDFVDDNANIDAAFATKSSISSSAKDINIVGLNQMIATFIPTISGNFEVKTYLRVLGSTKITMTASYADITGPQTKIISCEQSGLSFMTNSGVQSYSIGSYIMVPLFINAITGTPITINVTVNITNQVHVSCSIVGV